MDLPKGYTIRTRNFKKVVVDNLLGEGVLTNAKCLFPFFADYAKNEAKEVISHRLYMPSGQC